MLAVVLSQCFEATMLICFGVSWPAAILKTLRTKRVEGVSVFFLSLVLIGYVAGIAAKVVKAQAAGTWPEWVTALYALNAVLVGTEIVLYARYRTGKA